MGHRGLLISLEGQEGGGKSTQAQLLKRHLEERGRLARLYAEPGGTRISLAIRSILLAPEHREMAPRAEALLFLAARAQLVAQEILPALEAGAVVVCDRFTDSTLAYQGVRAGLAPADLERLNDFATGALRPDLTFLLDLEVETGLARQEERNRMEELGLEFHREVRAAYLSLARQHADRIVVVDASRPPDEVAAALRERANRLLEPS